MMLTAVTALALSTALAEVEHEAERYLRIVEEGTELRLDIAVRAMDREDGEGPALLLVGAAHVAGLGFYDDVQALLDGLDVTLFEGVRTADAAPAEATADWRRRATRTRMRALARRLAARRASGVDGLADLEAALAGSAGPPLAFVAHDAWGNPLSVEPREEDGSFEIVSLGADGAPGGAGADADLALTDEPALVPRDAGHAGLQKQLADALGLVFQLDAVDSTGPHWRNCDMSWVELEMRLEAEGVDPDELLGMLDGSSVVARLAGKILDWIGSSETGSGMLRLVGVELLGRADELLEAPPPHLAKMLDVILVERNAVVVECVRGLDGTGVETVGVFYGAGHLRPLEEQLAAELGYRPTATWWLPAIRVDTADLGLSAGQVRMIRSMVARQLDLQVRMARALRAAAKEDGEEPPPGEAGSESSEDG